jgi:hypothetical protein
MSKFGIYMIAVILSTNFVCNGGYGLEYFTVEQIMKDNLAINAPGIYYPDVDIGPDGVFVDYECRSTDVLDMADDIGVVIGAYYSVVEDNPRVGDLFTTIRCYGREMGTFYCDKDWALKYDLDDEYEASQLVYKVLGTLEASRYVG